MEAVRGQKHPSDAKHGKKVDLLKKVLIKVSQQPQKTTSVAGPIRFEL